MEISDDSENESGLASQARPPANTTRARAPHLHAPASGARAPVVPAPPTTPAFIAAPAAAADYFRPARPLKLPLPKLRRADARLLLPESCYNVIINGSIYMSLKSYLVGLGETEDANFPWWRVIQDFVHLYFEHFDHQYPVVHPYALEFGHDRTSWMVLLAVVTVGSQYSAFSNANLFSAAFGEMLSHAITQNRPQSPESTTLSYGQSVFLNHVCLMFDGSNKAQLKLQYERSVLVTSARVLKVDQYMNTLMSQAPRQWKTWLARESRIRLLHCIFRQPQSPSTQLDVRNASETMAGMDSYRRNLYMLSLYSEERLFLDKMSYSSIWKSSLSSQVPGLPVQEQWAHITSNPSALRAMMFQSMDEVFTAIPISAKPDYIAARDVIHHALSLLRLVSLHMLESFSGWQGNDAAVHMSANNLKHWMENDAPSARKCLWHAVCVYSTLKSKEKFACHDPLFFLISFFYIWAFDTLVVAPEMETPEASATEVRLLNTREIQIWIAEGPNTRLNLVGVGSLTGKASSLRLATEVSQIFSKRKSWAGLCRGLASAVDRIVSKLTIPQGIPQGILQGVPRGAPQGVPRGMPQGAPQGAPQGSRQGTSDDQVA
ncbi:hypothetical protein N7445_004972 [Penicillium cf. griseofulvum]|nr:hypothetical protein N7445_004972 [Penicillium cf. griseofulvum]